MKQRSPFLLAIIGLALTVFATYRFAVAGDNDPPGHINHHGFGITPCLVAFDFDGADGDEQTVLVDATITDIGGKRFLGGVVTDDYPEVKVAFPGTGVYIALDRIVYIQMLNAPKP